MRALVREAELVEKLLHAPDPQLDAPLLPDQALCQRACPLVAVQPIVGGRLVQEDVMQDLAPLGRQNLRDGPPLGGEQGIEAAMEVKVEPTLQGVPVDLLLAAHGGHGLPVPDGLQGQQPPPLALGLVPVVELLPQFPVFGGKALDADFSVHDTLL